MMSRLQPPAGGPRRLQVAPPVSSRGDSPDSEQLGENLFLNEGQRPRPTALL